MKNLKLICILITCIFLNTTVFATSQYEDLTINRATEKAIEYSKTLKTLSENSLLAKESYDEVVKDYLITDQSHESLNLVTRLKNATNKLTNLKASQELEKENIKLSIINFFYSVISAEKELELYKESIDIAEKELRISDVKRKLGLISETEYNSQKLSYDKQVSELSNKELTITNAYRSLNNVLGDSSEKRYNLIIDKQYLTFSSIKDTGNTLTSYITNGLSTSNKLTELKQNTDLAKYSVDTYSSLNTSSLQSLEISYTQAQRILSEAQQNLEQSITDIYNNILKLEDNYSIKLKDLSKQESDITLLEIKYKLGTATELELIKAKYQLKLLELEIQNIIFNHNIYKIKIENINLS